LRRTVIRGVQDAKGDVVAKLSNVAQNLAKGTASHLVALKR